MTNDFRLPRSQHIASSGEVLKLRIHHVF